jgi:hypothetical protein
MYPTNAHFVKLILPASSWNTWLRLLSLMPFPSAKVNIFINSAYISGNEFVAAAQKRFALWKWYSGNRTGIDVLHHQPVAMYDRMLNTIVVEKEMTHG